MNEQISHAGHPTPRQILIQFTQLRAETLNRFAKNFKAADQRILQVIGLHKGFKVCNRESQGTIENTEDIAEGLMIAICHPS